MTFNELAKEVTKEVNIENKTRIPVRLIKIILRDTIRVMIEELVSNPAEATINIPNIGKFYFREFKTRGGFTDLDGFFHPNEVKKVWTLKFRNSPNLRDVIRGRKELQSLIIAKGLALYPDSDCVKHYYETRNYNKKKKNPDEEKMQISFKRKYVKKKKEKYKLNKEENVNVDGRLPEQDA